MQQNPRRNTHDSRCNAEKHLAQLSLYPESKVATTQTGVFLRAFRNRSITLAGCGHHRGAEHRCCRADAGCSAATANDAPANNI